MLTAIKHMTIDASRYVDSSGSIIKSATLLADAVRAALAGCQHVVIRFHSLRGISSSYFNMFLNQVAKEYGLGVFDENIKMEFGSPAQEEIWQRSWEAARTAGK